MHSIERRIAKLETAGSATLPRVILAIKATDDNDRVTAYRFGYGPDGVLLTRRADESLDGVEARMQEHAGPAVLMHIHFVPADNGRPAWKNGVGPT